MGDDVEMSTQDLLLAVSESTPSLPVCAMNVLDLTVKYDLPTLLSMHTEALHAIEKPESLKPEILQQCQEILTNYAAAIRMVAKKVQLPESHPVTQALKNLNALEQQQSEVWSQFDRIKHSATKESIERLNNEWSLIATQVQQAEEAIIKGLTSADADVNQLIHDQKDTIARQQEALRLQREKLEAHFVKNKRLREPGSTPSPKKGGAFAKNIVTNVAQARQISEQAREPATAPLIEQNEQEQLAYQFQWEHFYQIFQEETRLSTDRKAVRWSQLARMSEQQIREAFPDPDCDVIFVVSYNEVHQLKEFGDKFISTARINRCDLLIVSEDDKPLFPNAGPFLEKTVPWHLDEVFKLGRAVVTMGGPELFCFVATSSASGRQNRLATVFQRKKLLAQGLGAIHFELSVPTSDEPWYAVTAEDKAIPGLLEGLGRKGPQCISNPHRNIRGARVIWHQLQPDDMKGMLTAYKNCPFFGIMREDEFLGDEMESCPLVLQLFPKANVRQAVSPYMWHMIHSSLSQHLPDDTFVSIQLASKTKVRVGLKDVSAAQMWLLRAKFELEVMGLNIKNERTNEPVSDFVDGSDAESTASNQSARSQSDKSSPMDQMVFYDVPPRLQEPDILQMFKNKEKSVLSASRLSWTAGDISLSAWQISGQDMMSLNGAVVRDPARRQPMYIISLQQYNQERVDQRRKAKDRRSGDTTPSTTSASSNKWKSSYVQVVRAKSKPQ